MGEGYTLELINKSLTIGGALGPLTLLFLFFARMFPIVAQTPFLGSRVMPHPVKVTLVISLFIIFLPRLIDTMSGPVTYGYLAVFLMAKELFIGLSIGFLISIPFTIVQDAGIFIDHQRGGASLMVNDPTIQNQSSPLGTLFNFSLICLFFNLNIPFLFFDLLLDSYTIIPADQFFTPLFFTKGNPFWVEMIQMFNKVMILSIQMAMPGLIIILMTDFFLGIANRLAPQVQITFLGMPLKSLLALLIVCLGWTTYMERFAHDAVSWIGYMKELIGFFNIGKNGT